MGREEKRREAPIKGICARQCPVSKSKALDRAKNFKDVQRSGIVQGEISMATRAAQRGSARNR